MKPAIDINPRDKEILCSLLAQYLPHTPVWIHGSRIGGGSKPWSDLDMVVFTGAENKCQLSLLKEAFEESNCNYSAVGSGTPLPTPKKCAFADFFGLFI